MFTWDAQLSLKPVRSTQAPSFHPCICIYVCVCVLCKCQSKQTISVSLWYLTHTHTHTHTYFRQLFTGPKLSTTLEHYTRTHTYIFIFTEPIRNALHFIYVNCFHTNAFAGTVDCTCVSMRTCSKSKAGMKAERKSGSTKSRYESEWNKSQ